MPGRRFTPEELARSAAAGEPRLDTDFHDGSQVSLLDEGHA